MVRFVAQCILAGLAILAVLVVALAWLPIPSEFRAECERRGGAYVPAADGEADLCVQPGDQARAVPAFTW